MAQVFKSSKGHTKILVIHGPNLNLVGSCEPQFYGTTTLDEINLGLLKLCQEANVELSCFQSNHDGALIDRIQEAPKKGETFIIINPAGYSHTSIALADTLKAVKLPYIEVHLSNIHARETFRHHSYFSAEAEGVICGLGPLGYQLVLQYALKLSTRLRIEIV